MDDWWTELDSQILNRLGRTGSATPAEIGRELGISEAAAASLLSFLIREGRVRMCLVALPDHDAAAH